MAHSGLLIRSLRGPNGGGSNPSTPTKIPMNKPLERTSRFLSLVLRHKPEDAGLKLDASGWCRVDDLLNGCASRGHHISEAELKAVVAENDKQRFQFSEDGKRIRASQGHSIQVDLQYTPTEPPPTLFHGTATRFLASIKQSGLIKGSRQHVHLTAFVATAMQTGARHGKPVIVAVSAGRMYRDGFRFYLTPNRVWLVDYVPVEYLRLDGMLFSTASSTASAT